MKKHKACPIQSVPFPKANATIYNKDKIMKVVSCTI